MSDVRNVLNPQGTWSNSTQYSAKVIPASTFDGAISVSCPVVEYSGIQYYCTLDQTPTVGILPSAGGSGWIAFSASATSGSGTVTSVSVTSANGFAGTVADPTTTPAISLSTSVTGILQGNGTAIGAASTFGTGDVVLGSNFTSWTPVLTAQNPGDLSVAYSTQTGIYTVIGNTVILYFNIATSTFTWSTASGLLWITGLPFGAAATNLQTPGSLQFGGITKANYTQFNPNIATGANVITFKCSGESQPVADVSITDLPSAGQVYLNGTIIYQM